MNRAHIGRVVPIPPIGGLGGPLGGLFMGGQNRRANPYFMLLVIQVGIVELLQEVSTVWKVLCIFITTPEMYWTRAASSQDLRAAQQTTCESSSNARHILAVGMGMVVDVGRRQVDCDVPSLSVPLPQRCIQCSLAHQAMVCTMHHLTNGPQHATMPAYTLSSPIPPSPPLHTAAHVTGHATPTNYHIASSKTATCKHANTQHTPAHHRTLGTPTPLCRLPAPCNSSQPHAARPITLTLQSLPSHSHSHPSPPYTHTHRSH